MEEPPNAEKNAVTEHAARTPNQKNKKKNVSKAKISGVTFSYIIVLVFFTIGVIICSVDGGIYDKIITMFFSNLGQDANNPDGSPNIWYQLGNFFKPDLTDSEFWEQGLMGQMISYIPILLAILFIIIPAIALGKETKQAKLENRKIAMPASMRYYKYGWLIGFTGIVAAAGIILMFKNFWGRPRPDDLFTNFIPWFMPAGFDKGESFMSGHTATATLCTGLALGFLGSRKKALPVLFGIGSATLVVITGMARMLTNDHYFSDVLWGGFVTYTFMVLTYFVILNIPGQERIYRYERTYTIFNDGYKLVLDGKAKLKTSPDEGFKLISAGLEKFAAAKVAAEDINKYHDEFNGFISRIDDLTARLDILINEYQSIAGKKEIPHGYLLKWSYVC